MKRIFRTLLIVIVTAAMLTGPVSAASYPGSTYALNETSVYAGNIHYGDDLSGVYIFRNPAGVLTLGDGSVIVADTGNQVVKRVEDGKVVETIGLNIARDDKGKPIGALLDGTKERSSFVDPIGMAIDEDGNLYVADAGNHAIRKISPDGLVTTLAGDGVIGDRDGSDKEARFYYPTDLAVASDGTIYVADTLNHVIRKISVGGEVTTLNAPSERVAEIAPGIVEPVGDYRDGALADSMFNEPSGLALDDKGNLYVSDTGNQRIRYIDFSTNTVTTVAGASYADEQAEVIYAKDAIYAEGSHRDGPAAEALFFGPKGLAYTEEGGLLIADSENHVIRYLYDGQVTTVVGTPERHGFANGIETYARLYRPMDVAIAADGSLYIADSYNNVIRNVVRYSLPEQALTAADHIRVVYEGELIEFDTQPEVRNGRTMVPVRQIAEALGYSVEYQAEGGKVTLVNDRHHIEFALGHTTLGLTADGEQVASVELDAAPYASRNRTYVPVRFFAEIIDLDVTWLQQEQVVLIRHKSNS